MSARITVSNDGAPPSWGYLTVDTSFGHGLH
jgi:hypothetical protein